MEHTQEAHANRQAVQIGVQDGLLVQTGTPEEIYDSGVLERVFAIRQGRTRTERGWRYYCELPPKEEE